jgi:hypothetical protein
MPIAPPATTKVWGDYTEKDVGLEEWDFNEMLFGDMWDERSYHREQYQLYVERGSRLEDIKYLDLRPWSWYRLFKKIRKVRSFEIEQAFDDDDWLDGIKDIEWQKSR